jgi:L-alanine-DL-glutamate epimerase-like enolase superfamily enzyme
MTARIAAVETVRADWHDNLIWVVVETDDGRRGLGETFFAPSAVEAVIHDVIAPQLLGGDPTRIEEWHGRLTRYPVGYGASGAEMRAASAIDIALWDLSARSAGWPLWRLMGGLCRDRVRVYNTCAGPLYATRPRGEMTSWFGIDGDETVDLDDLKAFMEAPEKLARALVAEGVSGMKIWPFDAPAFAHGGSGITAAEIDAATSVVARIRDAVGGAIDVMIEMHSLWDVESAKRIIRAVEPYAPAWFEDPIRMDDVDGVAELAAFTRIPILGSETTASKESFRRLLEKRALGIVSFDCGWSGGITEARKIAALADAFARPIAPHDCTGPVGYVAGALLSLTSRNGFLQETVRAYTRGWYRRIVTALPDIEDGWLSPLPGPGLGLELAPAFLADPGTRIRRSGAPRSS